MAIGDLHGDLRKTKDAFVAGGLIDAHSGAWVGGKTVAVQAGSASTESLRFRVHDLNFGTRTPPADCRGHSRLRRVAGRPPPLCVGLEATA